LISRSVVELGANAAAAGVAEMAITWRCAERHAAVFCMRCSFRILLAGAPCNSVAVVQPRQYRAARQSERQFGRQKMADVPDGLDVIVARRGH